ncbi:MAG: molybdate ABC transporter substrate-binding protein [Methanocalculus sp.]|uniref:molybdate ABC transporter substrate-binding protein n=1 Tax=Methanocalculus sp. TaxID=2004547 RepID=UPI002724CB24|nr:molybdate ABC transporter substrate-binding protein [Methanocalculus sp.]MDO9540540.1 molybdate ABC transporter substrate-binding protein [Methanocalculus sp.]
MNNNYIASLVILLIMGLSLSAGCLTASSQEHEIASGEQTLLVYAGAGLSAPMKDIKTAFEKTHGITIEYLFGGSGTLLSQMEITQQGDLFIAGGMPAYEAALKKGNVNNCEIVAYHVPIIVTPKGNPAQIRTIEDLGKPDIKVALGDADATAVGKQANQILQKKGILQEVNKNVVARTATVNELVTYITLGTVDVAIMMEDLYNPETMDCIRISDEDNVISIIPISVLTSSKKEDMAEVFLEFVISDTGKQIFADHNFVPYPDPMYGTISL